MQNLWYTVRLWEHNLGFTWAHHDARSPRWSHYNLICAQQGVLTHRLLATTNSHIHTYTFPAQTCQSTQVWLLSNVTDCHFVSLYSEIKDDVKGEISDKNSSADTWGAVVQQALTLSLRTALHGTCLSLKFTPYLTFTPQQDFPLARWRDSEEVWSGESIRVEKEVVLWFGLDTYWLARPSPKATINFQFNI